MRLFPLLALVGRMGHGDLEGQAGGRGDVEDEPGGDMARHAAILAGAGRDPCRGRGVATLLRWVHGEGTARWRDDHPPA